MSVAAKPTPAPAKPDGRTRYIALTFDDGPSSVATASILSSLRKVGGKATFFVVGSRVQSYASLVRQMAKEGHQIGNHSWSHRDLTRISAEQRVSEMNRTRQAILNVSGVVPTVMRPPYGATNSAVRQTMANLGFPQIIWSIDPTDWRNYSPTSVADFVLTRARDGSVVLMHDIFGSTAKAAAIIIPELVRRGYRLVTIDELMRIKGVAKRAGQTYFRIN